MNEYLITGGTGSLGKALTRNLLKRNDTKGIRIYSRDEYKQWIMKQEFSEFSNISYLIGDVRDQERLVMALRGVDIVINAAAMKHVTACEENPIEAVKTNINGATALIYASIMNNVKSVLHVSTDKAVYPINLYGATKTVTEKLFLQANVYSPNGTIFNCVRYGNVIGSRGSVIPLFRKQAKDGLITITDERMTRFFITLDNVAKFIIEVGLEPKDESGMIFVPRMPSYKILDLAKLLFPDVSIKYTGIRKGEKLHEVLITEEEYINSIDCNFTRDDGSNYGYFKITDKESRKESLVYSSEIADGSIDHLKSSIEEAEVYDY